MARQDKNNRHEVLKYFEIALDEARSWGWGEYGLFVVESLYTTVLPFIAGTELVATGQLFWIIFLILPIILRMNVLKKLDKRRKTKKIYVK